MTVTNMTPVKAANQCLCNVLNLWLFFIPEPNYQEIFDDWYHNASKMYVLPEIPGF